MEATVGHSPVVKQISFHAGMQKIADALAWAQMNCNNQAVNFGENDWHRML